MDPNQVTNALQSQGIAAFGLAMPILAPDWVDTSSGTPSVDDSTEPLKMTLSGNWIAPCTAAITVIGAGNAPPITLLDSTGAQVSSGSPPSQAGVLLTMFEAAWLRLCWLYANILEKDPSTPTQADGLPCRQVPRYFFYPGQSVQITQTNGNPLSSGIVDAGTSLNFSGDLWIFDNDGLPIDPVAVMAAFSALMTGAPLLLGGATNSAALSNYVSSIVAAANSSGTWIRLVNPDGTPATISSSSLSNLTALSGAPAVGVFTVAANTAIGLQPGVSNYTAFGPATTGQLSTSFTPPNPASGVTLQRDFFTLRLVSLDNYLLGAANSASPNSANATNPNAANLDPAISVTPLIPVRLNEKISLWTTGNDVMGAVGQALTGASSTLAVAQTLDAGFLLPPAPGTNAAWPSFPLVLSSNSGQPPLPMAWSSQSFKCAAALANPNATDSTKFDIVLTITFPPASNTTPDLNGAWIRIYPRQFGLVDATQLRGDGQGRPIPAVGSGGTPTVSIYLPDPLGLAKTAGASLPGSLNFDMIVVLPNPNIAAQPSNYARIYGGLSCKVTGSPGVDPKAFGTNTSTTAYAASVAYSSVLGLGTAPSSGPPNATCIPTMARREVLVAGFDAKWTGVIGGGRIDKETICALPRLGEPGGYGGRETAVTGASISGGPLAYDIARHALRRGQDITKRVSTLNVSVSSPWFEPVANAAPSPGQTSGSGTLPAPCCKISRRLATIPSWRPSCKTTLWHSSRPR
jgi:hypothetical protein